MLGRLAYLPASLRAWEVLMCPWSSMSATLGVSFSFILACFTLFSLSMSLCRTGSCVDRSLEGAAATRLGSSTGGCAASVTREGLYCAFAVLGVELAQPSPGVHNRVFLPRLSYAHAAHTVARCAGRDAPRRYSAAALVVTHDDKRHRLAAAFGHADRVVGARSMHDHVVFRLLLSYRAVQA